MFIAQARMGPQHKADNEREWEVKQYIKKQVKPYAKRLWLKPLLGPYCTKTCYTKPCYTKQQLLTVQRTNYL